MKLPYSLILVSILCLVFQGCSLKTTGRHLDQVKNNEKIPVDFVKEGSNSPTLSISNKYIYEIKENGILLGTFSKEGYKKESYRITILLEPRDYEIQLCQSEKVITTIRINPTEIREIRYNPSALDGFMEAGGKYFMIPFVLVTWPIWGPVMYFQHQ